MQRAMTKYRSLKDFIKFRHNKCLIVYRQVEIPVKSPRPVFSLST